MPFDINGLIYLRTMNVLSRFDMSTWKEMPFDFKNERAAVDQDGGIGGVSSLLFRLCFVETQSDRRLFIADIGNENILIVKL